MERAQTKLKHPMRRQFTAVFIALTAGTVLLCLFLNNVLLERYYIRNRIAAMREAYRNINEAFNAGSADTDAFAAAIQRTSEKYSIDMIIMDADGGTVISSAGSNAGFLARRLWAKILQTDAENTVLRSVETGSDRYSLQIGSDMSTDMEYMEEWGFLDNGNVFLFRCALTSIEDSVAVSNRFMLYVALAAVVVAAVSSFFLSKRLTAPIMELTRISEKMKDLNFEVKYRKQSGNELDLLGNNINELSEALETAISDLKTANNELQQDIARKEEIDAMRRDFLTNVSHELKTPIALIQGYAEGLRENVNDDEESRAYYCEVIMDEASKMNDMVRKLTAINELESGAEAAVMERFDLSALTADYLRSVDILTGRAKASLEFTPPGPLYVWADMRMTEEALQNYYTNALHHLDGDRKIRVELTQGKKTTRVSVFNTGTPIPKESLDHIWEKFYKVDKARSREYGGSGIGLSIVRAMMEAMHQEYGVINRENGVEFWFTLETG